MFLKILKKINATFKWFKIDILLTIKSIIELPIFFLDLKRYKSLNKIENWKINHYPVFLDKHSESASLGEYFFQDLFVAKQIIALNPERHIDVGSRIDGFIAHVACFRKLDLFDIRPFNTKIDNVNFVQWDITNPSAKYFNVADCVSCLHTLEHIGLGRYGDTLDPNGWKKGLESLSLILRKNGTLWLSVPIGIQRVEFNAHRVFHPKTILNEAQKFNLRLNSFWYLDNNHIYESIETSREMDSLALKIYNLGIFNFTKA